MSVRPIVRSMILSVAVLVVPVGAASNARLGINSEGLEVHALQEFSYSLTRLPESPSQYSLVLSDGDEKSISGIFSIAQLQILRAIMAEAQKFALTAEATGAKDPIVTRFEDKKEGSFVVDVEKSANQSRIFLTLTSDIGRMTVDAGKVIKSTKREEGFFFDLLDRLESVLPKETKPAKPAK